MYKRRYFKSFNGTLQDAKQYAEELLEQLFSVFCKSKTHGDSVAFTAHLPGWRMFQSPSGRPVVGMTLRHDRMDSSGSRMIPAFNNDLSRVVAKVYPKSGIDQTTSISSTARIRRRAK